MAHRPQGRMDPHRVVFITYFAMGVAGLVGLWLLWHFVLARLVCKCLRGPRYSPLELEEIRTRHRLDAKRIELARMRDLARVRERKRLYEENKGILSQAKERLGRALLTRRAMMTQEVIPTPRDEEGIAIYGDAWIQGVHGIQGGAPIREALGVATVDLEVV